MADLSLYELTQEWQSIEDALLESGGELTDELAARLDAYRAALPAKVDGYCRVIQRLARQAEAAKAEADRLAQLARVRGNSADSLKRRLLGELLAQGLQKVETDHFVVAAVRNSQPSIRWTGDQADLPASFRRVKVELDSAVAREVLKRDGALPDGFEVEVGYHVRIR